jgi:hypothetical protein
MAVAPLAFALASCTTPSGDPTELDQPIFGRSHPTTFVVAPTSETISVRDLATVARVLRRYKTLDAAERALVRSAVAKRLQGMVALEVQRIEPKYRAQREAIRRLPDRVEAARRWAKIDAEVRSEALARAVNRLTNSVAVPLKTSDNRSAVAFARISAGGEIEVASESSEVDRPISALIEGAPVARGGQVASFIPTPPVPVKPPETP